ncbi:MAG: thioredoxin-disulfide reductase [Thermodesulfobacteriota bacterium]|nr:thioredoxin-disulfide reductase [Thermodesulfobacteriota bacterium]
MKYYDTIIVGGGPAGLSAGIYAARAGLSALLLEKLTPGGIITTTEFVENYPGFIEPITGTELMERMEKQAIKFGLLIDSGTVSAVLQENSCLKVSTENTSYKAHTVILAPGTSPKKLEVKGEDTLIGRGVSFCATCDGPLFKGSEVAVVGGGDSALEEALYLSKLAEKVYIIHRRDQFRAAQVIQEKVFSSQNISIIWDSVVEEIQGNRKVETIVIRNVKSNETSFLPLQGLFLYVGIIPNTQFLKGFIELDEQGFIITDTNMMTNIPGVFAAGDARKKPLRQVVTAVSDGATASFSATNYLEGIKPR